MSTLRAAQMLPATALLDLPELMETPYGRLWRWRFGSGSGSVCCYSTTPRPGGPLYSLRIHQSARGAAPDAERPELFWRLLRRTAANQFAVLAVVAPDQSDPRSLGECLLAMGIRQVQLVFAPPGWAGIRDSGIRVATNGSTRPPWVGASSRDKH